MGLTLKQQKFVEVYITTANGNATRAATEAGYASPMQEGYRLLRNAEIQAEIERLFRERCMPPDEVLARLGDQARGAGEYVKALDGGRAYVDVAKLLADGKGHLIKGIKYTNQGQCIIEFHDAQAALVHIGRHHKLFTDRLESDVNLNLDDARDTLNSKLASLAARAGAPGVPE